PRYDVEYRVVRPDGTERIVHSQGDVTWDESDKPLRQFGVLQELTALSWGGRRKSCAIVRSAFAPSFSSPSTCTGRLTRSIALSGRSLLKGWRTRRRWAPRSARLGGKCLTS